MSVGMMPSYELDLHVHSSLSDGFHTPLKLAMRAKKIGLAGLAIVDHASTEIGAKVLSKRFRAYELAAKLTGVIVVPGIEFSLSHGHVIALFPDYDFECSLVGEPLLTQLSYEVRSRGGILIAAHIFRSSGFDFSHLKKCLSYIDAVEVYPLRCDLKFLRKNLGLPLTAGSDAHSIYTLGFAVTEFSLDINSPADVVDGIRRGLVSPRIYRSYALRRLIDSLRYIDPRFSLRLIKLYTSRLS